jgi:non-ribosomal peptide synthetase component F
MHNEMIEGFRLSPQQQRLWMLQQHSDSFRAECAVLVEGALKRDVLVEALRRVVMRHEILRTDFRMMPGVDLPWQIIGEEALAALREVEFDKKGDLRQQLEACLREESAQTTFDAEHGTPLRALLAKVDEQRHLLALSLPSLCADAWSLKNLLRDIVQLYAATAAGEELEDEAVQYVDFSEWQYELLESEDKRAGREFWQLQQQETADLPQFILPLEYRAAATEYRPETLTVEVEAEELRRIESLARGREVTTEAVLLACWQIFLWRATGSSEFVVHTAFDGGKYTDLRGSVGLFTKHLPLRAILDEGGTLGDTAQRVGQTHKEAYRRQEYFNQGRAEDAPESDSGIGFEYEEWPESLRAAQLTFTLSHLAVCSESFKLKLTASRTAEGLRLTFTYDSSLFSTEGVRDWAAGYQTLLRNALDAPDAPASSLLAMGEGERLRLLQDWCGHTDTYTHGDSSAHAFTSILDAFDHYVRLAPLHTAVVHDAASLSFSDLDARANQLAHLLRSRGLGPDSIAAIALERGVEMLVALLAVWKAGGAYLPLDPAQPSRRLAFMIEDAKARILITRQHLAGALSSDASHIICLDADRDEIDRQSRDNPTPLTRPEHLAYVIYTSGSTGKPKGVMVEHGSLLNLHDALRRTLYRDIADLGIDGGGEQETPQRLRVSLNAPLYFDASVKQLVQLLSGHTLVVIPEELRADARGLLDYLKQQQVDVLDCTPSLLRPLLLEGLTEGAAPSLRAVLSGGEAIDAALWGEMAVAAAPAFYNLYGPTECTVDATWRRVT